MSDFVIWKLRTPNVSVRRVACLRRFNLRSFHSFSDNQRGALGIRWICMSTYLWMLYNIWWFHMILCEFMWYHVMLYDIISIFWTRGSELISQSYGHYMDTLQESNMTCWKSTMYILRWFVQLQTRFAEDFQLPRLFTDEILMFSKSSQDMMKVFFILCAMVTSLIRLTQMFFSNVFELCI